MNHQLEANNEKQTIGKKSRRLEAAGSNRSNQVGLPADGMQKKQFQARNYFILHCKTRKDYNPTDHLMEHNLTLYSLWFFFTGLLFVGECRYTGVPADWTQSDLRHSLQYWRPCSKIWLMLSSSHKTNTSIKVLIIMRNSLQS